MDHDRDAALTCEGIKLNDGLDAPVHCSHRELYEASEADRDNAVALYRDYERQLDELTGKLEASERDNALILAQLDQVERERDEALTEMVEADQAGEAEADEYEMKYEASERQRVRIEAALRVAMTLIDDLHAELLMRHVTTRRARQEGSPEANSDD